MECMRNCFLWPQPRFRRHRSRTNVSDEISRQGAEPANLTACYEQHITHWPLFRFQGIFARAKSETELLPAQRAILLRLFFSAPCLYQSSFMASVHSCHNSANASMEPTWENIRCMTLTWIRFGAVWQNAQARGTLPLGGYASAFSPRVCILRTALWLRWCEWENHGSFTVLSHCTTDILIEWERGARGEAAANEHCWLDVLNCREKVWARRC